MKKVILLVCIMPLMAYGQVVENFETGSLNNWTQSTGERWKADTSGSISGRFSLHHIFDNSDAGTDQAGFPLKKLHPSEGTVKWSFTLRHGYDPSSSNNWSVFLMSDSDPSLFFPDGNSRGYAIGVNPAGYDDSLRLWKIKGNDITVVVTCPVNWQTDIGTSGAVKIIVERTTAGRWNVSLFKLSGELINTSSGTDSELFSCEWFIIYYKYSSSRDRLLWFDDLSIEGIFYEDNKVPSITGCETSSGNTLRISLSDQPSDNLYCIGKFSAQSVRKNTCFSYQGNGNKIPTSV